MVTRQRDGGAVRVLRLTSSARPLGGVAHPVPLSEAFADPDVSVVYRPCSGVMNQLRGSCRTVVMA